MAEVLRAAGITVHNWNADALPSISEARALFMAHAQEASVGRGPSMTAGGKPILPVPEMLEVLAAGDEAAAANPHSEPVPSGYFDDLDATPSRSAARG